MFPSLQYLINAIKSVPPFFWWETIMSHFLERLESCDDEFFETIFFPKQQIRTNVSILMKFFIAFDIYLMRQFISVAPPLFNHGNFIGELVDLPSYRVVRWVGFGRIVQMVCRICPAKYKVDKKGSLFDVKYMNISLRTWWMTKSGYIFEEYRKNWYVLYYWSYIRKNYQFDWPSLQLLNICGKSIKKSTPKKIVIIIFIFVYK